jgi:ribosomal protein S18 acetylase RimI-like enzyme
VRRGVKGDAPVIAQRVAEQLTRDAKIEPLVSDHFSRQDFEFALAHSTRPLWVDDSDGRIRGHLYGATFDDPLHGRQTWSGPDGFSYEFPNVLDNLCEWAYGTWREQGSQAHLVWTLAGYGTQDWIDRGYQPVSVRAAKTLDGLVDFTWPPGHQVRRGTPHDLDTALEFDRQIDQAQGVDTGTLTREQRVANEADLVELLDDPECHYSLLEVDGHPAAQCVTFPLPELRGNFENTLYVGSLAVHPQYRRRGLGTMLVHEVLNTGVDAGYRYAEVRWHIDNEEATALWSSLGFRPTYVQLRHTLVV